MTYVGLFHARNGIYGIGVDWSTRDDLLYSPLPSAETAVATKITRNISTLADGSVSLCAAGKNEYWAVAGCADEGVLGRRRCRRLCLRRPITGQR